MCAQLFDSSFHMQVSGASGGLQSVYNSVVNQAGMLGFGSALTQANSPSYSHSVSFQSSNYPNDFEAFKFQLAGNALDPVTCLISDWPERPGLEQDGLPVGSENIIQAVCGLMSVHGRSVGGSKPLGLDYLSCLTASLGMQATLALMLGQLRGSGLREVRLTMLGAGLLSISQYLAGASTLEDAESLLPGCVSSSARPPFTSADNVVFELETLSPEPWLRFWRALGLEGQAVDLGWRAFLLRYAKATAELPDVLLQTVARYSFSQLQNFAQQAAVSILPIRSLAQRSADADVQRLLQQGPWLFNQSPLTGAQETALLDPSKQPLSPQALPLSGLRIVESCRRIQGPLAGMLLGQLGAQVIRIEPPGGDPLRAMPPIAGDCSARFDALNRGKTVCEIDLKSSAGQEQVREILRNCDGFLHNWAPGKAAEFGLDDRDLAAVRPGLVYAYAGGWGELEAISAPGTDFTVQAYSGVAAEIGRQSGLPGGSLFTVLDVLGGVVAAQGLVAGLLKASMQAVDVRVDTSLLGASSLLCADQLQQFAKPQLAKAHDVPAPELAPTEFDKQYSFYPVRSVYQTQQGNIYIESVQAEQFHALVDVLEIPLDIEIAAFEHLLHSRLLSQTAEYWLAIFAQRKIPAVQVTENLLELQTLDASASCLTRDDYTRVNTVWSFL